MTVAAWRTEGEGGGIGADAGVDEPSQADKAQARKNVSKRRECVRAATLQTSLRSICNCRTQRFVRAQVSEFDAVDLHDSALRGTRDYFDLPPVRVHHHRE